MARERESRGWDFCRELLWRYDRRSDILGSPAAVERLSRPQLRRWKQAIFQPQRAVFVFAGPLSGEDLELAQRELACLTPPPQPLPPPSRQKAARFGQRSAADDALYVDDTAAALVGLTFDLTVNTAPWAVGDQLDLICSTLSSGLYAPLLLRLREELALVYQAEMGWSPTPGGQVVYLTCETAHDRLPQLLDELAQLLPALAGPPNATALACARACFATQEAARCDDPRQMACYLGQRALIGALGAEPADTSDAALTAITQQLFRPQAMALTVITSGEDEYLTQVRQAMKRLRKWTFPATEK